jgi:lysyl-tRNA synthetase class 2
MPKTWKKLHQNPLLIKSYLIREQVLDGIRTHFKSLGFHEVETPILVKTPGAEPYLDVFETKLRLSNKQEERAFLVTSPEYAMKKLLVAGLGNIFQITKAFRNGEDVSSLHNPEFTILEWYRIQANYLNVMEDFEQLFIFLCRSIRGKDVDLTNFSYQNQQFDLTLPWPRFRLRDLFLKYTGIYVDTLLNKQKLLKAGKNKGYQITDQTTWEQIYYQIFFNEIEPRLNQLHQPYFVYEYPLPQAALARKSHEDPRFAERFEVFLAGIELGNCFSELTDPKEQSLRLLKDLNERQKLNKTLYSMDYDFIDALKVGLPEASGIAVGVDRLIMLLADVPAISDTLFFPLAELFGLE